MLSVVKLRGEPKMLQFFVFVRHFSIFLLTSLKLRLFNVFKDLLRDISTFYNHFMSYMCVGTPNINTQIETNFHFQVF